MDLEERRRRVNDCLAGLQQQKELIALLLMSGSGGQLSEALVRNEFVDCLAFVGRRYLVLAVTTGEANEKLYGNFPDHSRMPEELSMKFHCLAAR